MRTEKHVKRWDRKMEVHNEDVNLSKKGSVIIWLLFLIYAAGYFAIAGFLRKQEYAWLLLDVFSLAVSVILLIRYKFPSRKGIVLSIVLAAIYLLSCIPLFTVFQAGKCIPVFLSTAASCSVFEHFPEESLLWVRQKKKKSVLLSILIGIAVGIVLGAVNYLLMKSNNPVAPADVSSAFLLSLSPAVLEEVSFRTVFYAFCLGSVGRKLTGRFEKFSGWFMMTVPHILPHISIDPAHGIIEIAVSWLIILVLYVLIFALAFAVLQKKRDILSAMIAHGLVDFIRFMVFGTPM